MWFISRIMCDFWFLVCLLSGCFFSFETRLFRGMFPLVKFNANMGFDWLFFFAHVAHVVALTICFSGKWIGNSVCYTSRVG